MNESRNIGSIGAARATLARRLAEPAPARLQLLVGPRQVGKSTLLLDLAKARQDGARSIAADAPASRVVVGRGILVQSVGGGQRTSFRRRDG